MLLTMREITARYRSGGLLSARDTTVLHQVNMEIARGEIVGLLGESGSGKSTLGKIIGGFLRPASGSVWFQGKRIEMPYRGELRRRIQMLAQHPETALNPRLKIHRSLLDASRRPKFAMGLLTRTAGNLKLAQLHGGVHDQDNRLRLQRFFG